MYEENIVISTNDFMGNPEPPHTPLNPINRMDLRNKINELEKQHHIQILSIIHKFNMDNRNGHRDPVCLNENANGTFINMNDMPELLVIQINKYVEYVSHQEHDIERGEEERRLIETTYFTSGDKNDVNLVIGDGDSNNENEVKDQEREREVPV